MSSRQWLRKFPIQDDFIRAMPWCVVEKYRQQIEANHSQTLERLAERGGLDPNELACAMCNIPLSIIWAPNSPVNIYTSRLLLLNSIPKDD